MRRSTVVLSVSLAVTLLSTSSFAQVTSNVFERVKRFRQENKIGSAFTIEVDSHQYVITARHNLVKQTRTVDFDLFVGAGWKSFTANAIYPANEAVDIVALDVGVSITVDFPLEPTSSGLTIGQPVYFVGYPWGLATRGGLRREGAEIPFVKSGVLSAMDARHKDATVLYVDGHNNPGFSGGPVVFRDSKSRAFRVAGVVQAYRFEGVPVVKKSELQDPRAEAYEDLYTRSNTGILLAYGIQHIVNAIEQAAQTTTPAN